MILGFSGKQLKLFIIFISKINESILNSLDTQEKRTEYLKKNVTLGLARYQSVNKK